MQDKYSDVWFRPAEVRPLRPNLGLPSLQLDRRLLMITPPLDECKPFVHKHLSDDERYTQWANRNKSSSIVEPYWVGRGCGRRTLHNRLALPWTPPAYHITIDGRIASSDWEADLPGCENDWVYIREALCVVTAEYSSADREDVRAACRGLCAAIHRFTFDKRRDAKDWCSAVNKLLALGLRDVGDKCIRKMLPLELRDAFDAAFPPHHTREKLNDNNLLTFPVERVIYT